jgi:hypothetical protein
MGNTGAKADLKCHSVTPLATGFDCGGSDSQVTMDFLQAVTAIAEQVGTMIFYLSVCVL